MKILKLATPWRLISSGISSMCVASIGARWKP